MSDDREEGTGPESGDEPGDETPANDRSVGAGHVPSPPPIGPKKSAKEEKEEKEEAKRKRGRPSGKIGRIPEGVDSPSDAEILWVDVLERIQAEGRSAHEMVIRIARVSPGPYAPLGPIEASSVEGGGEHDPSPADLLRDAIIDTFHLSQGGPATYDVAFQWKRGSTFYDRGKLHLPSMREIELVRNAIARRNGQQQQPYPPQRAGAGAPPPQYAPQYAPPPPSHYAAPGYAPQPQPQPERPSDDPLVSILREIRSDQARLSVRVEQIAAGQAAPTPAPTPQTPPLGMIEAIQQFAAAADAMKKLGFNIPGIGVASVPAAVAAPPAPPPPPPQKTEEEIIDGYFRRMEKDAERKKTMARALGATLPEDLPEEEEEPEEKKKEPEKPGLGFHPHVIPNAHWPDGSPMQHATDDEGNWDIGGIVMSNPFIIDKMGTQLLRVVEKVVEKVGVGAPGGQQQQQPEQEQIPEETEPNGAAQKKEWKL